MNDKDKFIVTINGKEKTYYTVATYTDEKTNKNYIIYTDGTLDNNQKVKLYTSLYEEINNKIKLIEIKDKEDKIVSLNIIKSIMEDLK